jgi:multidrug efflux system outer membrane protein
VVSMNLRRWIIGLIGTMTLLMNGCMVGPNYHPPKAQAPGAWVGIPTDRTGQESVATPDPVTIVEWWKSFNDPVLDSLIDEAVKSNYDLQRAEARILQARAARGVTASGLYPSVNASASAQRSYAGAGGSSAPSSQSVGAKARNLFQVGLDAAWEMDFFGGVRRSVEAANADLQAAFEDRRDVFVTLTSVYSSNSSSPIRTSRRNSTAPK